MDAAEYFLLGLNVTLGLGFGWLLARRTQSLVAGDSRSGRLFAILVTVYFAESVAFMASMGSNILSIALAAVWGSGLMHWCRRRRLALRSATKVALLFSLYSSLPAASFLTVPGIVALGGWSITSVEQGVRFGIPEFLPWPINTILGFCIAVAGVAVVCKVAITVGLVRLYAKPDDGKLPMWAPR